MKEVHPVEYIWHIRACLDSHLDDWIKDHFEDLQIRHESNGSTLLTGKLQDMSAVYGLILQLRDTGSVLLSLHIERVSG